MKDRLRHIIYVIVAVIAATICGCNASGCLENRSSVPLAGFYSSATGAAIQIDSLVITGIGKSDDKPLYDGATPIQEAYLPMRSTEQSTAWDFACRVHYQIDDVKYSTVVSDTIEMDYESSPYFASEECGVIFKYTITKMRYTTHLIDSVVITDSLITNLDIERIKIYYRTE